MPLVGVAYKGQGHLVRVYDDSNPRGTIDEKDTLSTNHLVNFLLKVADTYTGIIPISKRLLSPGYQPIDQNYYEKRLLPRLKERGGNYKFFHKDPRIVEAEQLARKQESRQASKRKRRDIRLGKR